MAKHSAAEIVAHNGDVVFVTWLEDDAVGLTVIDGEQGRSIYLVLDRGAVDGLREALVQERDK